MSFWNPIFCAWEYSFYIQDSKTEFTKTGVNLFSEHYSNVHGEKAESSYKLTLIVMIIIQNRQKSAIVPDVRKWPQTKVAVTGSLSRKKHTDQKKKKSLHPSIIFTQMYLLLLFTERGGGFLMRRWEIRISLHLLNLVAYMDIVCRMTHVGLWFHKPWVTDSGDGSLC